MGQTLAECLMQRLLARFVRIFLPFVICLSAIGCSSSDGGAGKRLQGEYLWHNGNTFERAKRDLIVPPETSAWKAITFPGQPEGRTNDRKRLWLRFPISQGTASQEAVVFDAVDEVFDAWVDGQKIYSFGNPEEPDGVRHYIGSKTHIVKLPLNFKSNWLYLRVLSDHTNIGPYGSVRIGPPEELLRQLVVQDIPELMAIGILVCLGIGSLLLFLWNRDERVYLTYGVFVLLTSAHFVFSLRLRSYFPLSPQLVVHLALFFNYAAPAPFAAFLNSTLCGGKNRLLRFASLLFWLFSFVAIGVSALGVVPLLSTLAPFQVIVLLLALVVLWVSIRSALSGDAIGRVVTLGFVLVVVMFLHDVLDSMYLIHTGVRLTSIGFVLMVLCLAAGLALRADVMRRRLIKDEADIAALKAIQDTLIPHPATFPSLDIAVYYKAADAIGGDWYGYHLSADKKLAFFFVGDVTGHGVPSALLAGVACGAVMGGESRMEGLQSEISPGDRLLLGMRALNEVICETGARTNRLMTMYGMALELETGRAWTVNAGHCLPYHHAPGGRTGRWAGTGNRLGWQKEAQFEVQERRLKPGEVAFLFTDGLLENTDANRQVLTHRALCKVLEGGDENTPLNRVVDNVIAEAETVWKGNPIDDDVTILAFRWMGPSASLANGCASELCHDGRSG